MGPKKKKPEWQQICLLHGLQNILVHCWDLLFKKTKQNETFLKRVLHNENVSGYLRVLIETDSEINVVFMPINTAFILYLMDQKIIFTFKNFYLINTFCKSIAALNVNYNDGSGQSEKLLEMVHHSRCH